MSKKQKKMLLRILLSAVMMVVLSLLPLEGPLRFALFLIPYLVSGYDILGSAFRGILNRQVFDENFLMAVATVGAMILGEYTEAVAVMVFYQTGELFQNYALGKSRQSIGQLMDIRPDYANIRGENGLEQVDPEEVEVGTLIVVQPGEKIPIDGEIVTGTSSLDTSALTGESVPREVEPGDAVISGCINQSGLLEIRTTREFAESTVSKILELVEESGSRKSRSEKFISRFARVYTPAVCISALALALLPPLILLALGSPAQWGKWIYRGLTFLVISCPCALVISIPLTFFAGIGGASRQGILVKGSNYLEALAQCDRVVFDKTGTLTQGKFQVVEIVPQGMSQEQLLEYAALAEHHSTHPISRSVQKAYTGKVTDHTMEQVKETSGHGVEALVDGHRVVVGSRNWLAKNGVQTPADEYAGKALYIAVDDRYAGFILIRDQLKPNAKKAIESLKREGVRQTVMLTGDSRKEAEEAARELHIDQVFSQLLPADKVTRVETLLQNGGGKLAYVGDGINDAPVLARADVGIAMGAMGSDAAIEAADVVLMDDDPAKIAFAIRMARKCMTIVRENIVFALGIKLLCLLLVVVGISNMWLAIFADVGVMVIAVLNAIRALYIKERKA